MAEWAEPSVLGPPQTQVVEVEAEPMPLGPRNPHGVGFDIVERVLRSEHEAQRMLAPERSRVWKVRAARAAGLPENAWCWRHASQVHLILVSPPCSSTAPAADPEPQQHQPRDWQAGGLEADAGQLLPTHAGPRECRQGLLAGVCPAAYALLCYISHHVCACEAPACSPCSRPPPTPPAARLPPSTCG